VTKSSTREKAPRYETSSASEFRKALKAFKAKGKPAQTQALIKAGLISR